MKRNYEYTNEKPFNFAALLLERLNERFNEANLAAMEADVFKWYRLLGRLVSAIVFKLQKYDDEEKSEELKDLDEKLKDIRVLLKSYNQNQNKEMFYFNVESKLEELERTIVLLMDKYELYYPKYSHKKWQEKAKEEDL